LAESAVSGSAAGLGCWLVVATVQPTRLAKASSTSRADKKALYCLILLGGCFFEGVYQSALFGGIIK
jgi:hypothetical protein